jgi:putative PIN family toxin of toxin-antitoxin system
VADWKVVADSNVLISALLWTGSPHKLLKLAENKAIILYSSLPIIEELSDVLARDKFADRINELKTTPEELIESLLNNIEIIRPAVSIKAIKSDPDDNKILECAVEAGAGFIVSGDPHLLNLRSFREIEILAPAKFLGLV